jgi:hypothetical protein
MVNEQLPPAQFSGIVAAQRNFLAFYRGNAHIAVQAHEASGQTVRRFGSVSGPMRPPPNERDALAKRLPNSRGVVSNGSANAASEHPFAHLHGPE